MTKEYDLNNLPDFITKDELKELLVRLEDIEYRLESVEGEVDIEEVAQNVQDKLERFIIDEVRIEIDAIDFKVTVER